MRIVSATVIQLKEPVPVFDLTVPGTENFLLGAGVFVHNCKDKVDHPIQSSKDVADAVCGAYYSMLQRRASWVTVAIDDKILLEGRAELGERSEYRERL